MTGFGSFTFGGHAFPYVTMQSMPSNAFTFVYPDGEQAPLVVDTQHPRWLCACGADITEHPYFMMLSEDERDPEQPDLNLKLVCEACARKNDVSEDKES